MTASVIRLPQFHGMECAFWRPCLKYANRAAGDSERLRPFFRFSGEKKKRVWFTLAAGQIRPFML